MAIYGLDGTPWAVSPNWPGLSVYEQEQETENGLETVLVDEWAIVLQISTGARRPGIRMGKEKYTFLRFNNEYKSAALVKSKGGAFVCKTAKCVIIGTWDGEAMMSNNTTQNQGDCSMSVEDMAVKLREDGF